MWLSLLNLPLLQLLHKFNPKPLLSCSHSKIKSTLFLSLLSDLPLPLSTFSLLFPPPWQEALLQFLQLFSWKMSSTSWFPPSETSISSRCGDPFLSHITWSLFKMVILRKPSKFLKDLIMSFTIETILIVFLVLRLLVSLSRILLVGVLGTWFLRRSTSTPLMMIAL